jgi:DNA replication protein DnaC
MVLSDKAELGSPFDYYGRGPRIRRLTTWVPERWQADRDPSISGLPVETKESMRFSTWKERDSKSLDIAYFMAKNFARGNLSWGNILVLSGPTGTGKTHLALATAWEWFDDGCRVVFADIAELLENLRGGYDDSTYRKRLELIKRCDLLVIDELGVQATKEWAAEKIDVIINHRYINRLPLIVTTNAKGEDLPPRVASRLVDHSCSQVVQIDATDYRTTQESKNTPT